MRTTVSLQRSCAAVLRPPPPRLWQRGYPTLRQFEALRRRTAAEGEPRDPHHMRVAWGGELRYQPSLPRSEQKGGTMV